MDTAHFKSHRMSLCVPSDLRHGCLKPSPPTLKCVAVRKTGKSQKEGPWVVGILSTTLSPFIKSRGIQLETVVAVAVVQDASIGYT